MAHLWTCRLCGLAQRVDPDPRHRFVEWFGHPDDHRACRNIDCDNSREAHQWPRWDTNEPLRSHCAICDNPPVDHEFGFRAYTATDIEWCVGRLSGLHRYPAAVAIVVTFANGSPWVCERPACVGVALRRQAQLDREATEILASH